MVIPIFSMHVMTFFLISSWFVLCALMFAPLPPGTQESAAVEELRRGAEPRVLLADALGHPRFLDEGHQHFWGLQAGIEDIDASGYGARHSGEC